MTTNYQLEAQEALVKCNAKMTITLSNTKTPKNWESKGDHNHYRVTIKTSLGRYSFDFWGSINDAREGKDPTEYDVIACLEWNTPESFEDFCAEYGYEEDSRKAENIWKDCRKMTKRLNAIFTESQIEILSEIR